MYTTTDSDFLKRKHCYLSPPLTEIPELDQDEAGAEALKQAIQVDADTHSDCQVYKKWSGRGRSPFKTPATAAVDGLKERARLLEAFEREINLHQYQLDNLIVAKKARLYKLYQSESVIAQGEGNSVATMAPLRHPSTNTPDWSPHPSPERRSRNRGSPLRGSPSHGADSRSQSRSRGGPQQFLNALAEGTPSIVHYTFEAFRGPIHESVLYVRRQLEDELDIGCMPLEYKEAMEKSQPYANFKIFAGGRAFGNMSSDNPWESTVLWQMAMSIFDAAKICQERGCDENAWIQDVVLPVLSWEVVEHRIPGMRFFSQAINIQTQQIHSNYIQTTAEPMAATQQIDRNSIQTAAEPMKAKKADYALAFSSEYPEVAREYAAISADKGPPSISQMNDVYTSTIALYLGAEVKKAGGNGMVAQGQCFQWLGAGVMKLRTLLLETGKPESIQPLLGWVIVGHKWELYLAIGEGNKHDDRIIIFGPLTGCTVETDSYFGTFKLLRLISRVKEWAEKDHWPWYCEAVLTPMKTGSVNNKAERMMEGVNVRDNDYQMGEGVKGGV